MAKDKKSKKSKKPSKKTESKKSSKKKTSKAEKSKIALKKKQTAMLSELESSAKVINVRMEKYYAKAEKANDDREAAAIEAASAKEKCESVGIKFKTWCDDNLTGVGMGYNNMRKLAIAGASDDVKLAIADMRVANKEANKKLRDKKEAEKKTAAKKKKKADKKKNTPAAIVDQIVALYEKLQDEDRDIVCNIFMRDRGYEVKDEEEEGEDGETEQEDEAEDEAEAEDEDDEAEADEEDDDDEESDDDDDDEEDDDEDE